MKCDDARKLMSPFYDNELVKGEHIAVEKHLMDCPKCLARFREMCGSWEALGELPIADLPDGFRAQTLARVRSASAARLRRITVYAGAMAAAFIISFCLVFFLSRPAAPELAVKDVPVVDNLELIEDLELLENYELITNMGALDELTDEDMEDLR